MLLFMLYTFAFKVIFFSLIILCLQSYFFSLIILCRILFYHEYDTQNFYHIGRFTYSSH